MLILAVCASALAVTRQPPDIAVERKVEGLLQQLSLSEKVSLLSGATAFGTAAVERLGLRAMRFADGPNGVRSNDGDAATVFPVGLALAASWNPALVREVGRAIGEETRALGHQVLLGPNLNLVRSPLSGRNFETYGEDPWLVSRMGVGFITGVQSAGVGASAKHFVGNEQETQRTSSSSNIDERTLHEIYLPPFEAAVREARPWTVMTAYNRLNGTFMSEHEHMVRSLLKEQWDFDGVVMSDWGGTHSLAALRAGLDLEMPGPPLRFGERLLAAVHNKEIDAAMVDDAARRMLRLSVRTGALQSDPTQQTEVSTVAHRSLARRAAAAGMTLLKNEGELLPLDARTLRSIAVIGPNADTAVIQGSGSAQALPSEVVTPLDAIRALVGQGAQVTFAKGTENDVNAPAVDARWLSPTRERKQRGLTASYYANAEFSGAAAKTRVEQNVGGLLIGDDIKERGKNRLSVRWQGYFWPPVSGEYEFTLERIEKTENSTIAPADAHIGTYLKLDGQTLIDPNTPAAASSVVPFLPMVAHRAKRNLLAGRGYPIQIDYAAGGFSLNSFRFAVRSPADSIEHAAQLAKNAEVAVVFVGSGVTSESEGRDRDSLQLFGEQNALVEAVRAANPRTVVVLNHGGPVEMSWVERVPAILEAWLPGQEGARAVADVLFGRINPSGKLPLTFPKRLADNPSYRYYPGEQQADYGEGVFMGYRHYDKNRIEPLFPFGHGLSYTRFEYRNLRVRPNASRAVEVSVEVQNVGKRAGAEVAQLYLSDPACGDACAVRELKSFDRVELRPGETRTVVFQLAPRAFMRYNAQSHAWVSRSKAFHAAVGSSSRDLRLSAELVL